MPRSYAETLSTSVKDETTAVKARFQRAEAALTPTRKPITETRRAETTKAAKKKERDATKKKGRVRDTFSFPFDDHSQIEELRLRAAQSGHLASKSEIVRAALRVLSRQSGADLVQEVKALEKLKPGPKSTMG